MWSAPRKVSQLTSTQVGVIVLSVVVLAGSTSAILIRWSQAPSTTKVFYRLLLSTALVVPVALHNDMESFRTLGWRDTALSTVSGVVLGGHFIFFFRAVDWTTVAASTMLAQTHVVFVALAAYLVLDERVTTGTVVGIGIALLGVGLLSTGGVIIEGLFAGEQPILGNLAALMAAALFGIYTIAGRSIRQRFPLFPYVSIVYGIATVSVGLFGIGTGAEVFRIWPATEWLLFLGMAVGPGLGTHTLYNWALKYVDSTLASVSLLLVPVVSALLAFVLLSETPSAATGFGAALVFVGLYLTVRATPEGALSV